MLILTRRINEVIRIGDHIQVVIVAIEGNKVRLGITAPRSLPVHRQEVYEAIHAPKPPEEGDSSTWKTWKTRKT